jgi:hypothetical protein
MLSLSKHDGQAFTRALQQGDSPFSIKQVIAEELSNKPHPTLPGREGL